VFTDRKWTLASGGKHTCGILDGNGGTNIYCWGDNSFGQIGISSTTTGPIDMTNVPHPVANTGWSSVSSGNDFSCAIDNSINKQIYCWGSNASGQLAISVDPTISKYLKPILAESIGTTNDNWVSIFSGPDASCAIKTTGRLFCWGNNFFSNKIMDCTNYKLSSGNTNALYPLCDTSNFVEFSYSSISPTTWKTVDIGASHILLGHMERIHIKKSLTTKALFLKSILSRFYVNSILFKCLRSMWN